VRIAAVGVVLAAVVIFSWSRRGGGADTSIVLPFANRTGDTAQTFLSDASPKTDGEPRARFELRVMPNSPSADSGTATRRPRQLPQNSVNHVLTGSLSRRGDSVRVTVELVDRKRRRLQ
jgi:TolB-like protein